MESENNDVFYQINHYISTIFDINSTICLCFSLCISLTRNVYIYH